MTSVGKASEKLLEKLNGLESCLERTRSLVLDCLEGSCSEKEVMFLLILESSVLRGGGGVLITGASLPTSAIGLG